MLGTSDAWSMSRWSHRFSEPVYYIEDCLIYIEKTRFKGYSEKSHKSYRFMTIWHVFKDYQTLKLKLCCFIKVEIRDKTMIKITNL